MKSLIDNIWWENFLRLQVWANNADFYHHPECPHRPFISLMREATREVYHFDGGRIPAVVHREIIRRFINEKINEISF